MTTDPSPGRHPVRRSRHLVRAQDIPWPARARVLILWSLTVVLGILTLAMPMPFGGYVTLKAGDVAPTDIVAPRRVTYISQILTQERRELAASAVPDVYEPSQARIGRQQLAYLNRILDFIGTVRSDTYADLATKAAYLDAIAGLDLPPEIITRTLTLPGPAWERVAVETQVVLERAMREEIRENTLAEERRKVPARVRLDMADEEAEIVSIIVQALLVPNTFYNAEKTEQRRQQAREQVQPVTATVERNETILRAGDVVTPLDIEALEALGLTQHGWSWETFRSTGGFVLLLGLVLLYYLWRQEPQFWLDRSAPWLLSLLILLFLLVDKLLIPNRGLLPYLCPYAALTILLSTLLNLRLALVVTGLMVLVVGWLTNGSLELMTYALCAPLIGALKLRRGDRLGSFAWTAGYVMLVNLAVVTLFQLVAGNWTWRSLAELAAGSLLNGLITMTVALAGIYLAGTLFGIPTPLLLMELSRPTHPLLRQLLLKAPGTYHHTLIVANMAERAAEAIGADPLLARVGAYYHDVGKAVRPYFFSENQSEGVNPHVRLDPYTSAQIIITHIKDGIDLARKYHLPQQIINFIPEHQGTGLASYFYHQALAQASNPDEVDEDRFRYPGPKPQSRETAITMLADGAEAMVRSRRPESLEELEQIVAESIQARMLAGELDECPLTIEDLQEIRKAFVDVLRGLHHPRIPYPPAQVTPGAGDGRAQAEAPAIPSQEAPVHAYPNLDDPRSRADF
jgi:putative nucleotidyltransferase with HDIG domain